MSKEYVHYKNSIQKFWKMYGSWIVKHSTVLRQISGLERLMPPGAGPMDPQLIDLQRRFYPGLGLPGGPTPGGSGAHHIPGVYPPTSLASDLMQRERERLERMGKFLFCILPCVMNVSILSSNWKLSQCVGAKYKYYVVLKILSSKKEGLCWSIEINCYSKCIQFFRNITFYIATNVSNGRYIKMTNIYFIPSALTKYIIQVFFHLYHVCL